MLQRNHRKKVSISVCDVVLDDLLSLCERFRVIAGVECGHALRVCCVPIKLTVDVSNDCVQAYIPPIDVDLAALYFCLQGVVFGLGDFGAIETKCRRNEDTTEQAEGEAQRF